MSVNFDRAADYYDATRGMPPGHDQQIAALFYKSGNLAHTSEVLEIGIGTGRIALPIAVHVKAIYGIDLSWKMMEKLRHKQMGEPVYLTQGDATQLPFGNKLFDAVVGVHVLHLIPNWQQVLEEVGRVLKPQGVFLYGLHQRGGLSPLRDLWHALTRDLEPRTDFSPMVLENHLLNTGWQKAGRVRTHEYRDEEIPRQSIEEIRTRKWSNLWSFSEDVLQERVAAYERELTTRYDDLDQPIETERRFQVWSYRREVSS